jgi:hypothetical protein
MIPRLLCSLFEGDVAGTDRSVGALLWPEVDAGDLLAFCFGSGHIGSEIDVRTHG